MIMNLFEKAISFALKAHEGQIRKKSGTPYILHPIEASVIAATMTDDPEILSAVVLHDTIEDTDVTEHDLRREFGERVTQLVLGETEKEYAELSREESWKLRKEESLTRLRQTQDKAVRILWLSDKLSNIRSLCRLQAVRRDAMWDDFHQKDSRVQEWYYRSIAEVLSDLSDTQAYKEYVFLTNLLFGGAHENPEK